MKTSAMLIEHISLVSSQMSARQSTLIQDARTFQWINEHELYSFWLFFPSPRKSQNTTLILVVWSFSSKLPNVVLTLWEALSDK